MTGVNRFILKVISLLLLAVCLSVVLVSMALAKRDEAIYPSNVAVGGISIANLNHEYARERLANEMGEKWEHSLKLKIDKNDALVSIPISDLGIEYNLDASLQKVDDYLAQPAQLGSPLQHAVIRGETIDIPPVLDIKDINLINNKLLEIKKNLDKPATDARVLYTKGYLEYLVHANGFTVDLEASRQVILKAISQGSLGPVSLVVKDLYPKVKAEDIKNINSLIGVSVSGLEASQIGDPIAKHLLLKINGTIVMPGDEFSINTAINEALPADKEVATRYQQMLLKVSNTMANACQSARLSIGSADPGNFKFSNNLANPIMIYIAIEDDKMLVKIFGCQTDKNKEIVLIKEQTVISPEIEVKIDRKLKPGDKNVIEGQAGKKISTYRIVKVNGEETEKKLLSEEIIPAKNTVMQVAPGTGIK